ncbi:MAG: glycosyltransferase, partial [Pirellulaceae bacterium]|nr:glycosyltransferase [Pirellulaceae bacterium]
PVMLATQRPMPQLCTSVVPHGAYALPAPTKTRKEMRDELQLERNCKVMLSFGHIRDGKNLDLVLGAMEEFPDVYLIVAGSDATAGHKSATEYRSLATAKGVSDRCRWRVGYISSWDVGNYFIASDLALLTYSGTFKSASGVLNTAVRYRCPCLASGGEGNLKSVVINYDLGVWVAPDDTEALVHGLRRWSDSPPTPRWDDYEREHSWTRNAELVMSRLQLTEAEAASK